MPAPRETLRLLASKDAAEILIQVCNGSVLGTAVQGLPHGQQLTKDFEQHNLVTSPDHLPTRLGRACHCGVDLIEGNQIQEIVDRLRMIDPDSFRISIVKEGMTGRFLRLIERLDRIRRVMICSPWTNLRNDRLRSLLYGLERAKRLTGSEAEVSLVTRPEDEQPGGSANPTITSLRSRGALIAFRRNLHSKLYIVETASSPPQQHAFVGSENFTQVRFDELGIYVNNDAQLIAALQRYFIELLSS